MTEKDLKHIAEPLRQFAVATSDLRDDPRNPRTHDDRNRESVEAALSRFGQRIPLVVQRQGMIVRAGNNRLDAARNLGWKYVAAVVVDENDVEAAAYAIADNRTQELSRWDIMVLAKQLEQIAAGTSEDDLGALGFTGKEIEQLAGAPEPAKASETVEGKTSKRPKKPITQPGDLWCCGRHRVICAANDEPGNGIDSWIRLIDQQGKAAAMITDPPYGINYVGKTSDALEIQNDDPEGLRALLDTVFERAKTWLPEGSVWWVFAPAGRTYLDFCEALEAAGVWQQTIIWKKNTLVLGRNDYHYQHEHIMYGWTPADRGNTNHRGPADPSEDSVWEYDKPQASRDHPTMKPVGMVARMIANSTKPGDLILDPFLGSGSTLIAADQMGRRCFGFEADPGYCDVIVRRYQALTGIEAVRMNADDEEVKGIRLT